MPYCSLLAVEGSSLVPQGGNSSRPSQGSQGSPLLSEGREGREGLGSPPESDGTFEQEDSKRNGLTDQEETSRRREALACTDASYVSSDSSVPPFSDDQAVALLEDKLGAEVVGELPPNAPSSAEE